MSEQGLSPEAATPARGARNTGLDRARAVAVVAMVMGHTLDAVLSDAARQGAGVQAYWALRAITAPLFLFVAGWAIATTVQRTGEQGLGLLRRYAPRAALLLCWGYVLRWPGWGVDRLLAGERAVWEHFLGFDALHGVAGALLMGAGVLALLRGQVARMAALTGLAVLFPVVTPWVRASVAGGGWPLGLEQAVAGRGSSFPLFPWSAYFFAGAVTGLGLATLRRVPAWLCLAGTGLTVLGLMSLWGGNPELSDATLVAWRMGMLLVVAGAAMRLPSALDGLMGPVGRASLWAYVIHLPMTYGWSTFPGLASRWGHSLSLGQALATALTVLAVTLTLSLTLKGLYGRWRSRARKAVGGAAVLTLPRPGAAQGHESGATARLRDSA
jgi:uncharacterized membrane protein